MRALKIDAMNNRLHTQGIEIMKVDNNRVFAMFPSNDMFPPVWYKNFTFDELEKLLAPTPKREEKI